MLPGSHTFEFPGPSGQEGNEAWPGSSSDGLAGFGTSTSAIWPDLLDTDFPVTVFHSLSNISASWPSVQQVCLDLNMAAKFLAPVDSGVCATAGALCWQ